MSAPSNRPIPMPDTAGTHKVPDHYVTIWDTETHHSRRVEPGVAEVLTTAGRFTYTEPVEAPVSAVEQDATTEPPAALAPASDGVVNLTPGSGTAPTV